jgi:hypothetical protein
MLAINNCTSQSTKKTPYEMVFGQPSRIDHEFWLELHKESSTNNLIVNEEDLPDSFLEKLNHVTTSVRINSILFVLMCYFYILFRPFSMIKTIFLMNHQHLYHLLIRIRFYMLSI